ncbi:MAG: MnhB domain-containing protein [Candidatus Hydrogenedentota bacterium]
MIHPRQNNEIHQTGMSLIVKTVTRLTVGLILLYGIYIVLYGHLTHGGGFPGGVIIALSFVHLLLAFGRKQAFQAVADSKAVTIQSIGAVVFIAIALLGFAGGHFLGNVLPKGEPHSLLSAGTMPLNNIAICLKVLGGLYAIFLALIILNPESEQ